ncbi:MAG TPA: response regulator [Clostridiales bacterium]|nr:response regulator [Clostridiales bacterium]
MLYKVILVEDDPLIREGLSKIISWNEFGLEVVGCAADGEKALRLLEDISADVCITDIKMPHMDGLTLMKKCNGTNRRMKYVVLSGYTDFELVKEAAQIGIENYLVKPVNKEELVQTLVTIVEKLDAEQRRQEAVNEGIQVFRDNLLYRWITGGITYEELLDRKSYLGFPILNNYMVGIIRLSSATGESQVQKMYKSEKEKRLKGLLFMQNNFADSSAGMIDLEGNLLLLFPDADVNYERIDAHIQKMVRYAATDQMFYAFAAMGTVVKSPGELEKSYYEARFILDNYAICSEKNVVWYEEISQYIRNIPSDYYEKMLMLTSKFNPDDKGEIFQLLEEVMGDISRTPGIRWETLQAFGVIFLGNILQNIKRYKPHIATEMEQLQLQIAEIYQCNSLKEMIHWMKELIEKALIVSRQDSGKYSQVINGLIQYMKFNYDKDICIKNIADLFHMSPVYLGRLFFQETGKSFTEYLNSLRLNQAKDLLANTDIQIQQIAEKVGYQNSNYFYTVFKKKAGMTPAEFRCRSKKSIPVQ